MVSSVQPSSRSSKGRTAVLTLIVVTVLALIVATAMAAVASWTHLALAFHAVELSPESVTPQFAAVAVEVGLLALAASGALLAVLTGRRDESILWSTVFFAVVSFLANVYAGLHARTGGEITLDALDALSRLDWTVVVVGAGTLPVMVVVLTHVTITVCRQAREWWTGETAKTVDALPAVSVPSSWTPKTVVDAPAITTTHPSPSPVAVLYPPSPDDPVAAYIEKHGDSHVSAVVTATGYSRAKVYGLAKAGAGWRVERGMVRAA